MGCGTGYDTTGVLSYVGAGGDYRQETTYKYVGQGAGDFEVVPVPTNFRSNICLCIIPLLLLLLVPLLLYLLPQLSAEPVMTTLPPIPAPTPAPEMPTTEPYDCNVKGLWSLAQKGYCCKKYGAGCPTTPPPTPAPRPPPPPPPAPATPPPPPNCAVGAPASWPLGKKTYCCIHHHIGCPTTPAPPPVPVTPPPYVPPPVPVSQQIMPVTTSCPFDCNAGFSNWQKGWSPAKKEFCC